MGQSQDGGERGSGGWRVPVRVPELVSGGAAEGDEGRGAALPGPAECWPGRRGSGRSAALRVPPSTAPRGAPGPPWGVGAFPKSSDGIRGVVEIRYPALWMYPVREICQLETSLGFLLA